MKTAQPGILAPVPPQGRYLFFTLKQASALRNAVYACELPGVSRLS